MSMAKPTPEDHEHAVRYLRRRDALDLVDVLGLSEAYERIKESL